MKYEYPGIRRADLVEDYFGHKLEAPYTWLRNTDDPEVKDFTKRENDFTDKWFSDEVGAAKLEEIKKKLRAERTPDLPMYISPWKDGYLATEDDEGNYKIISLDSDFNKREVLFERYDLPERTPFVAEACPLDDNILGIMSQIDNAPRPDFVIYDYSKKEIKGILPMTFSGLWSKRKKILYAASTKIEGDKSLTAILAYDVDSEAVREIMTFDGNAIFGNLHISEDGRTLILAFSRDYSCDYCYSYDEESGEIIPLNEEEALPVTYIDTFNGKHYFISFKETPHGQVVAMDMGKGFDDAEVIYTEEKAFLENGYQIGDRIFIQSSENAASRIFDLETGDNIEMPESIGSLGLAGKTKDAKVFSFDAFLAEPMILNFDGNEFKIVQGKKCEYDDLVVELLSAPSVEDKKEIPYYLVRRRDDPKDGNSKALMYGYGGYNISMPPWSTERITQTNIASWVREGGIYVHCLLRGGSEYGSTWHDEGMGLKKKNCYYDFIGIAEKVIADGYTRPERIAISGASNGGLLMSALVTMRPDLWGCVIASVPHTDMIHFANDDRGPMYITEYGNPMGDKETFEYLLSYSPVHNVRETAYPPIYIQTGECDNNVPPYHGKSFAATLQEKNQSDNPVLLRVLEKGSHDRGQGEVFWQTLAEMRAFMEKAIEN